MKPKKESLYIGNERIKRSIIFFYFLFKEIKEITGDCSKQRRALKTAAIVAIVGIAGIVCICGDLLLVNL